MPNPSETHRGLAVAAYPPSRGRQSCPEESILAPSATHLLLKSARALPGKPSRLKSVASTAVLPAGAQPCRRRAIWSGGGASACGQPHWTCRRTPRPHFSFGAFLLCKHQTDLSSRSRAALSKTDRRRPVQVSAVFPPDLANLVNEAAIVATRRAMARRMTSP